MILLVVRSKVRQDSVIKVYTFSSLSSVLNPLCCIWWCRCWCSYSLFVMMVVRSGISKKGEFKTPSDNSSRKIVTTGWWNTLVPVNLSIFSTVSMSKSDSNATGSENPKYAVSTGLAGFLEALILAIRLSIFWYITFAFQHFDK